MSSRHEMCLFFFPSHDIHAPKLLRIIGNRLWVNEIVSPHKEEKTKRVKLVWKLMRPNQINEEKKIYICDYLLCPQYVKKKEKKMWFGCVCKTGSNWLLYNNKSHRSVLYRLLLTHTHKHKINGNRYIEFYSCASTVI